MKSSLQALDSDLQNLRDEINLGPVLGSAINSTYMENKILRAQLFGRSRRMTYVHGIVSIYGLIEEHIDSLMMEIASAYAKLYPSYGDLPECVRLSHRECSLRVLLDGDKAKLRESISEAVNLNILTANYNNAPLQLNPAAFTYANANYRPTYVAQLMRRLDINIDSLVDSLPVKQALSDSGLEFRNAEVLLDDLVRRRNKITHSYQASELLEVAILVAYLDVVSAYLKELFAVASTHLLGVLAAQRLKSIGSLVKRWTECVGVEMTAGRIQSPCNLMFIKESRVFVRTISSLQSGGIPIAGVLENPGEMIELGLAIDEPLPNSIEGAKVFVLPDNWLYLKI